MKYSRRVRARRVPINIHLRSGQISELMVIATALQSGLRTALEELASRHDFMEGVWLDDLEQTLINDASNIWSEGLALDSELRALHSGRELMRVIFEALRQQLRDGSV